MPEVSILLPLLVFAPLIVAAYLGWRFVRAVERRSVSKTEMHELREQVLSIEQRMMELADELHALEDGHRFVTAALAARTAGRPPQGEQ